MVRPSLYAGMTMDNFMNAVFWLVNIRQIILSDPSKSVSFTAMVKVLVLTYYWPPAGGAGVQRWLKFVKYMRGFGWEPVVYTASNGEMPVIDESLLKDIPAGITVLKTPIWEPYTIYKRFIGRKKNDRISASFLSENK